MTIEQDVAELLNPQEDTPFADALGYRALGYEAKANEAWARGVEKFKRENPDKEPPQKPWGDEPAF